jgi:hypothetical protein
VEEDTKTKQQKMAASEKIVRQLLMHLVHLDKQNISEEVLVAVAPAVAEPVYIIKTPTIVLYRLHLLVAAVVAVAEPFVGATMEMQIGIIKDLSPLAPVSLEQQQPLDYQLYMAAPMAELVVVVVAELVLKVTPGMTITTDQKVEVLAM